MSGIGPGDPGERLPVGPAEPVQPGVPAGPAQAVQPGVPADPATPVVPPADAAPAPAPDADGDPVDMAALADYLDRGRTPRIAAYEDDPDTRNALRALEHMRDLGRELVEAEAEEADAPGDDFFRGVLAHISRESRAGRDIPLSHPDPGVRLALTEGAVRTLVRQAGDEVPGVLIGRCTLDGDVTLAGEPVRVALTMSVVWGDPLPELAQRVRERVHAALLRHTELRVEAIDVTVVDVQARPAPEEEAGR
ncbi:Asp23/Gls24 family envelope stress response protein [Clavibacter michiganensis]|uniref:Asp23/Gls24 family envelope stress response protein n=1 Tax=Clavibacter michiganensis TaxID=28447 RepID=UPI001BE04AD4|nr:Asp23/Gls24 family envelope stress response protein [Clavibacter michiganensis]MBT1635100.1 Asp23/Gls24 family envelope stress response protein [Clavibacter michiganensis]